MECPNCGRQGMQSAKTAGIMFPGDAADLSWNQQVRALITMQTKKVVTDTTPDIWMCSDCGCFVEEPNTILKPGHPERKDWHRGTKAEKIEREIAAFRELMESMPGAWPPERIAEGLANYRATLERGNW